MTPCEALHTAARSYCQERIDYWHQRYSQLGQPGFRDGRHYSDRHKKVFPRYNVLECILVEVERLRPEACRDLREFRNRLWSIGQSAQGHCTEYPRGTIEQRATQEERDLFSAFVDDLQAEALEEVMPLPYRRTLLDEESREVWDRIGQLFGLEAHEHWYPLQGERPPNTVAFAADPFYQHLPISRLQSLLADAGVSKVWELREYGPEYEMDLALLDPIYNGAEGYWTSESLDWLLYASHESTVTVSGAWLLVRIQAVWPEWESCRVGR